ncbi:MAG: dihydrodipicolinate synthase family protein [Acidisphaera sp.]|nr:dihydrodipicolinate synthase family protein [Acidisphaera sp.]
MPLSGRFEGLFSVTVTPFTREGMLDLPAFATILEWHIAQGSAGLAIAADNGEASLLTLTERQAMAETAVRVAGARVPVIMGAMGTHAFTAAETIKMAEVAAAAGVSAVLIAPSPYVGTATRAEVVGRYRDIYRAVPLPVIAYNNPRIFGVALEGDTLQQLIDEIDLVGIKESSRHFLDISQGIARFGDRISILMGCGYLIMPGIALGARGILSTGVDLFGRSSARIVELARGPWTSEARRLHLNIARAYSFLLETGTPPAALKALLNLLGLPAGVPRLPVHPLAGADLDRLRVLFTELGVLSGAVQDLRAEA